MDQLSSLSLPSLSCGESKAKEGVGGAQGAFSLLPAVVQATASFHCFLLSLVWSPFLDFPTSWFEPLSIEACVSAAGSVQSADCNF